MPGGPGLERRLVILMGARLALSSATLAIALLLEVTEGGAVLAQGRGFYATVVFAFLATVAYGLVLRHVRWPRLFAVVNIASDIGIVSALVHFSGSQDSVFTFLYMVVVAYAALLFGRRGALAAAGFGSLCYGAVLLAGWAGWLVSPLAHAGPATALVAVWAVHSGAVVLVAALSSVLAGELARTGEALHQRTSDLERLRDLHHRTVTSLMSGLLTTDAAGRVTSFNPEAERITGISAAAALGRPVEAILPGVSQIGHGGADESAGGRARVRMAYRSARGESLHLGIAVYVLQDAAGAGGHVVIFQDVTRVVRMERELRRSERLAAVGELSASIAHEIRNPLAAISGSIQMLRPRLGDSQEDAEPRRLMEIVLRETDRLNHLLTDFLVYARPGPLALAAVPVAEAVEEVLKMFEAVRTARVETRVAVEPGLALWADAARLRQVLWNLLLNAAQAMPEGGSIEIGARAGAEPEPEPQGAAPGGRREDGAARRLAELWVADTGVGIAPDVIERIFDPFFTTRREGSGLGLATVHRIAEDHGGSVRLESRVGHGTRVRVLLPLAEERA